MQQLVDFLQRQCALYETDFQAMDKVVKAVRAYLVEFDQYAEPNPWEIREALEALPEHLRNK